MNGISAPNQMFPSGEPDSVIRGELKQDEGDSDMLLIMTHSRLTKSTAFNFGPWLTRVPNRFEAILNNQLPPDWARRFLDVKELYTA